MANPEHVEILKQGVEVWNEWREKNPDLIPELRGMRVSGSNPVRYQTPEGIWDNKFWEHMDINGLWNLKGINFKNSDLKWAEWHDVDFSFANFNESDSFGADFVSCILEKTDFSNARIGWTEIKKCYLSYTNFSFSKCNLSSFSDVDLSRAIGLEKTIHEGPSSVGIDTIYNSRGQIPLSFLRGCGVPEDFIKLIPDLVAQPFEFYKCFISHSSNDMDFCKRLHADLQNEGVRVWFFPEDARTGRGVWDEIDKSIKIYDKLMVVCSENSLQSGPVLREIERALQREDREHKHILFPIRIDDYIFDEWEHPRKADVIAKVVGDFSNWTDYDSYQKAFDRLMRDLKASEE